MATRDSRREGVRGRAASRARLLAYLLVRTATEPLQRSLGLTSAEAQIGVVMTGIMFLLAALTFLFARLLDGLTARETLRFTGVTGFDRAGVLAAVAVWLALVAISAIFDLEDDLPRRGRRRVAETA